MDPLRSPRRARRVEHSRSEHRILDVRRSLDGERRLVRLEAGNLTADGEADARARRRPSGAFGAWCEVRIRDERLGVAIVDDVGCFVRSEVPVDRREPEPGAPGGAHDLCELRAVTTEQRDAIMLTDTAGAQRAGKLIGASVEL